MKHGGGKVFRSLSSLVGFRGYYGNGQAGRRDSISSIMEEGRAFCPVR